MLNPRWLSKFKHQTNKENGFETQVCLTDSKPTVVALEGSAPWIFPTHTRESEQMYDNVWEPPRS